MNDSKQVKAAVLACTVLLLTSGAAHALGFGRPNSHAVLGDTLSVSIPIRVEAGEDLDKACVVADVYFGDDKVPTGSVQAGVLPGWGEERVLKLRTLVAVNEPVVTVYLAAGCQVRITRKLVVFADPPGLALPEVTEVIEEGPPLRPVAPGATPASPSPSATAAEPAAASAASRSGTPPAAPKPGAPANRPRAKQGDQRMQRELGDAASSIRVLPSAGTTTGPLSAAPSTRLSPNAASAEPRKAAPREGARLMLDPIEVDATLVPGLRMAEALGQVPLSDAPDAATQARRQAAAALWHALNASPEQQAQDRQRLLALEARLVQLQRESTQAQAAVAALRVHTQQVEAQRLSPMAGWALGAAALTGLLASGYLLWQLRRARQARHEDWWHAKAAHLQPDALDTEPSAPFDDAPPDAAPPLAPPQSHPASGDDPSNHPTLSLAHLQSDEADSESMGLSNGTATLSGPEAAARDERGPAVSVDELIDLEQQADFFVVLGQDTAAMELLERHVQGASGGSALPWLQLMEIYQRLGRRDDHERAQAEFRCRFLGDAPAWASEPQPGRDLTDHAAVIARLQAVWPTPWRAMALLEALLTRPQVQAEPFALPAYRDLLWLYAVARDLWERPAAAASADLGEGATCVPLDVHLDDLHASAAPGARPLH